MAEGMPGAAGLPLPTGDQLDALLLALVREHRPAHAVPDGVDALHVRLPVVVDHHHAALRLRGGSMQHARSCVRHEMPYPYTLLNGLQVVFRNPKGHAKACSDW